MLRELFAVSLLLPTCLLYAITGTAASEDAELVIENAETVQISGFKKGWHNPFPDRFRFDACHRRLLVRFPDAAQKIAAKLDEGHRIEEVMLVLPFKKTETWPKGYAQRSSFGVGDKYERVPPRWHAVAWLLRHPWTEDKKLAPTFNAWIRDTAFWEEAGAGNQKQDRFPKRFGPTEVSTYQYNKKEDPLVSDDELGTPAKYRYPENIEAASEVEEEPEIDGDIKNFDNGTDMSDDESEGSLLEDMEKEPAHMDVTDVLSEKRFGDTLGERLRCLTEQGFLLRKWETYDMRYKGAGSYPWAASTGGRAIVIQPPRLKVTFNEGPEKSVDLPAPTNLSELAKRLAQSEKSGTPPLTMPDNAEIKERLESVGFFRREWMPEWQWERLKELRQFSGDRMLPQTPEEYKAWVEKLLQEQPRYWDGWDNAERLLAYYRYAEILPNYVREHYFHDYWEAWLQPDKPNSDLVHPKASVGHSSPLTYYRKTGDWRGNCSFYRKGFTQSLSTMNFNHTAAMGALLGGAIIDSEYAMRDGRQGLEQYPMRTWAWYDGSTQESIDHYYFALTLVAQKMFADFGPKHIDRMMGRSILAKSVEELASAYHPRLRHFLASASRTNVPDFILATQGGIYSILHTLSREGALHDLDKSKIPDDMAQFGNSVSPVEVQQMSMVRPWAPEWFANIVDGKTLPYHMTCAYKKWGKHAGHPLWRKTYLGKHYGLASTDITAGTVQILGHWQRDDNTVKNVQQLGTMDVWYGINQTFLANPNSGHRPKEGMQATLQHQNKMLVVTSPDKEHIEGKKNSKIHKLQSTLAFYNYETPEPTWKVYRNGEEVTSLPAEVKPGDRITIHDGVTYIGIIPLPAADLGNGGIRLHQPDPQKGYTDTKTQAALAIESYNLRKKNWESWEDKAEQVEQEQDSDLMADEEDKDAKEDADNLLTELDTDQEEQIDYKTSNRAMDRAYGGWVIEYGDATEYDSFDAFREHFRKASLNTEWRDQENVMHVSYESGDDTLEMGVNTLYAGGSTDKLFTTRKVNGEWPYLPENLDRDSSLTQQGRRVSLKKNGAELQTEKGLMAYLQTEPKSGTYVGWNPLPDLSFFNMKTPDGIEVRSDGRVSITRVEISPSEDSLSVDHALKNAQKTRDDLANALFVFGFDEKPDISFNNEKVPAERIGKMTLDNRSAYYLPLRKELPNKQELKTNYQEAQNAFETKRQPDFTISDSLLRDWHVLGPFTVEGAFPEKTHVNPGNVAWEKSYEGAGKQQISWHPILNENESRFGGNVINLKQRLDGPNNNVCAYATTTLKSDKARDATFWVGSDDSITIWLNGEKVLDVDASRAAAPDQNLAQVHLNKGSNRVVVRIGQRYGGWGFFFRVADRFGNPLGESVQFTSP